MTTKLSRRDFILRAAAGMGALSIISGCSPRSRPGKRFLDEEESTLLEAVAEQIIPTDDWPGGRDAGVASFIDIQLMGPYRRFQKDYRTGLAAISETCRVRYGKRFETLPWDTQTSFLVEMEAGRLRGGAWGEGFSGRFFALVKQHCLQGFYGSPRHGGNRNFVSYKMIGLDQPPIIGQNRYRT